MHQGPVIVLVEIDGLVIIYIGQKLEPGNTAGFGPLFQGIHELTANSAITAFVQNDNILNPAGKRPLRG